MTYEVLKVQHLLIGQKGFILTRGMPVKRKWFSKFSIFFLLVLRN